MIDDLIPENAPFDEEQRAWLNGFLAGLLGLSNGARGEAAQRAVEAPDADSGEYPWMDPALELERRLELAEGRPLELRLMAALAQLDCGQCGYSCRTYARALASGSEQDVARCYPGGRATARAIKTLLAEAAAGKGSAVERGGAANGVRLTVVDERSAVGALGEQRAAEGEGATGPSASASPAASVSSTAREGAAAAARVAAERMPAPALGVAPGATGALAARYARMSAEAAVARGRAESSTSSLGGADRPGAERELWRVKAVEKHAPNGSDPELCELVLDRGGTPIPYRVGDCLAIAPQNDPDLVRQLLRALRARGQEVLATPWGPREAWRCLLEDADVTHLRDDTLELLARSAQTPRESRDIARLLEGSSAPASDLLELLEAFPSARPRMTDLVATLGPIQPRLYTIATSPSVHPTEVRIAVRVKGYEHGGRERKGVASSFIASRVFAGDVLPAHVQHGERFALPEDDQTPLVMLGYGTGVARFRALLEELDHRGRRGNSWLFLHDRPELGEPLYEAEIKHWLRKGVLERLDAERVGAPKRAPAHDLLKKRARMLGAWLERGALLYIAGEALEQQAALEETLCEILARQLEIDAAEAALRLKAMRRERRYVSDTY